MNQEKVGKFIKDIRIKNKLTQKEFADKFGVTYQAVSKWENGKNLPDINILKDICNEYSVSLDEVVIGTKKESDKKIYILKIALIIGIFVIFLGIGIVIYFNNKNSNSFEFKTLTSTCNNFKVSGSIAYNDIKSSIYISHVDYCGGDDNISYKKLSCILYEVDKDVKKEVSKYSYDKNKAITLEKFLSDVTFNIDNYAKVCKSYQENSFILEVDAINDNGEITTHKIPLKLEDNC